MVTKMGLEGKGKLTMMVLSVLGVVTALVKGMVLDGDGSGGVVVTTMMVIVLM